VTKFQRAKMQTVEKLERVLAYICDGMYEKAKSEFTYLCAFCNQYEIVGDKAIGKTFEHPCQECPAYKVLGMPCTDTVWYNRIYYSIERMDSNYKYVHNPDKAIPYILAIKMWIEELKEE